LQTKTGEFPVDLSRSNLRKSHSKERENQSDFVIRTGCQKCDEFPSFPFSFFDEKLKKVKNIRSSRGTDFKFCFAPLR
jgi:hypothetical protein